MTEKNEKSHLRDDFDNKSEKSKATMKNAVISWVSSTNIHGLPHLINRENIFKRVLWCLLSLAALTFLVHQLFTMLDKFYSYPTKTVTMRLPIKSANFPAVSFCDMNIISRYQLSSDNFTHLREKFDEILMDDLMGNYYEGEMGKIPNKDFKNSETTTLWKPTSNENKVNKITPSSTTSSEKPSTGTNFPTTNKVSKRTEFSHTDSVKKPVTPSFNTKQHAEKIPPFSTESRKHFTTKLSPAKFGTKPPRNDWTSTDDMFPSYYSSYHPRQKRSSPDFPAEFTSTDFYSTDYPTEVPNKTWISESRTLEESADRRFRSDFIESLKSTQNYVKKKSLKNGEIKTNLSLNTTRIEGEETRRVLQRDEITLPKSTSQDKVLEYLGQWNHELDKQIYENDDLKLTKREAEPMNSTRSEMQSKVRKIYADLNEKDKEYLGKQIDDLIHEVTFLGQSYKLKDFDHFLSPKYGNCYTFNSGSKDILTVQQTGPGIGLDITLSVNEFDYLPTLSETVGIVMVIHDQKVMPFPMSEGYSLSPGFDIKIGLNLFVRELAGHPYGSCKNVSDIENSHINAYRNMLPRVNYTFRACYATCMQQRIIKKCQCVYPFLNSDSKLFNTTSNLTICDIDKKKAKQSPNFWCALKSVTKTEHEYCSSRCPQDCLTYKYDPTFSFARWPSKPYYEAVLKQEISHKYKSMGLNDSDFDEEYVRKNYMRVSVYFESMELLYVRTEASYDLFDMLSDLGGQLGLWMGISLLTIAEIVELLYDLTVDEVARRVSRS